MYIKAFNIENFRSLKNVNVVGMQRVVAFHGANNAGKSNVLAALQTIFMRKLNEADVDIGIPQRPVRFWQGLKLNCFDDFYLNGSNDIRFGVDIYFSTNELRGGDFDKWFLAKLKKQGRENCLQIKGLISSRANNSAYCEVQQVLLNSKSGAGVVYSRKKDKIEHFPEDAKVQEGDRVKMFERLMEPLHDCVKVIPSNRYMVSHERFPDQAFNGILKPENFKTWLYFLSMDRTRYAKFKEIVDIFSAPPFDYGKISFAKIDDALEIMVEKNGLRLPINRVGSGLKQILYLISCMIEAEGKILGVEELEINLSPKLQNQLVEKLRQYCLGKTPRFHQLLLTTHSEKFSYIRSEMKSYQVKWIQGCTQVDPMTKSTMRSYYSKYLMP